MKSEKNDRNERHREMYTKFCKTHPHEMWCENTKKNTNNPQIQSGFLSIWQQMNKLAHGKPKAWNSNGEFIYLK